MASTSILPLQLGQAILGRALEPDIPAPEYLRIDGECWKLVTDPAAVQAAQDALAAREKANEAFAMAQYAPRIANRPPSEADAEGKAPGAGWLEYDPATQQLKQMWRWTGQAWEELPMDPVMIPIIQIGTGTAGDLTADRLIVTGDFVARVAQILQLSVENLVVTDNATINELVALSIASATAEFQSAYIQNLRSNGAVIDEAVIGDLAANIITSGLFRTSSEGQRWEIDSNGIVMYGVNEEGIEYELVRIGPAGTNLLTIGDTTIAPTSVSAPEGNFEELAVGGRPLTEWIQDGPRGVVAWGQLTQNSAQDTSTTFQRRAELQTSLQPGRLYRGVISSHYLRNYGTSASVAEEAIHTSWDYGLIFPNNPGTGVDLRMSARHYLPEGRNYVVPGMEFIVDTGSYNEEHPFWVMFSLKGLSSSHPVQLVAASHAPLTLHVEDLGPSQSGLLKRWNDNNGGEVQDPQPTERRYTKTYTSTGFRCYNLDGSDAGRPDVVHGLYSGGPERFRRRGGWLFPSMTGDLSGAKIEKVEMYISCTQTYSSSGSTVRPAVWGSVMKDNLDAFTSISGWKAGQSKWVTVPAAYHAGFKSGQYSGVGVIPSSNSVSQYARFDGSGAKIRVTYTK